MCNCLIAGFDAEEDGASLYWIDYMGTLCKVTKGAHGFIILNYNFLNKFVFNFLDMPDISY